MLKKANWQTPKNVQAFYTTRNGGVSNPPFFSFNPALHVGDDPKAVLENRRRLRTQLPSEPIWLNQIHSDIVIDISEVQSWGADTTLPKADASHTTHANRVCAILTADCLPVLLCNKQGTEIAAIHAGWRGMSLGIIEKTMQALHAKPSDVFAWLGPAICQNCYEIGPEVKAAFSHLAVTDAFKPSKNPEHFYFDLKKTATLILKTMGVEEIEDSSICTAHTPNACYSYRREGQTGRIACLIWRS